MAKMIFRGYEVKNLDNSYVLELTKSFEQKEEEKEVEVEPIDEGPSKEDLEYEIEQYRSDWEKEKAQLQARAQAEADQIIKNAEKAAFNEVKRQNDQAQEALHEAEIKAKAILDEAKEKAEKILEEAEQNKENVTKQGYDEGFESGREEGFEKGQLEVNRLIERLHKIIETSMNRRQEILAETEQQIIDLVILMTRKIVKVISENQRNVISNNIVHALRRVKGRADVVIRVNLADFDMTTKHKEQFIAAAENIKGITILEDTSVDPGGCIVETDFGSVDARIASQLHELEQRILEISPIRTNPKKPGTKE
ncbi:flagellar assembly protein FliH [Treponema phagedenis]|uniref:Flagellar assembly protein FliH n=1 Tax=Treponema phagedenis TaxID=162 RepID=A0A0B7GVY6_TREPH|nr:flagellar assembly protein FliH [Treponema phagedenis]EFW39287.1 flagellar assembly protein FliH [Treponema phagedenis F0421]NVP24545.1 flagellar assembly protein FliH [Treponema phagedenis]QEJ94758.1 flagellar assembly protein FliH [Treponema phagedenis]QEJ97695.1 flagellar assembly protein FliH [Treponema phagedenis]QEK00664.1 flagellar assembly protein FliH [Treponema phagedenis]